MDKINIQITRFNKISVNNWIVQVNRNICSDVCCIIMFHQYKHTVKMGFVKHVEDVVMFITTNARTKEIK